MRCVSSWGASTGALTALVLCASVGCSSNEPSSADETGNSGGASSDASAGSGTSSAPTGTSTGENSEVTSGGDAEETGASTGSSEGTETGESASPGDCISDPTSGERRVDCGHLSFDLSVPQRCLRTSCGLIVDVHGRTMSGPMQEANTGLKARGLERGYIVIQPNANPAPPLSSWDGATDDATVVDFVEEAIGAFEVDPDRVHLTGFSQGGSMTWRLLADYGELWASAAPAAACGIGLPSAVVPLLYMHGTADVLTEYECAEPHVDALREHYGLVAEGEVVDSSEDHVRLRYGDEAPAIVELLSHDYDNGNAILGGHCYPGSDDPGEEPGQLFTFACGGDEAFAWGGVVIDFFEAHPRTPR